MAFIKHQPDDSVSLEGVFRLNTSFIVKADGTEAFSGDQSMGGFSLTNVATPLVSSAAANKDYVDNFVQGLSWKDACRAATTANIALSGLQIIDGVTLLANERVLVKNQTLPEENGIYEAVAGGWPRSADADTGADLASATVAVEEGSTNLDTRWTQTNDNINIGVDPVTWVFIGAGAGVVAATFVVSPTPNVGDYTDIQSALNALPAAGGLIFVREGTYAISSTLTLPNKPVKIVGCGTDATIIDIGANTIAAITVGFDRRYTFEGFRIQGSGVAGQRGFTLSVSMSTRAMLHQVEVNNVEKPFFSSASAWVVTSNCHFRVANLASSVHWDGNGLWYATNTECDFIGGTPRGGFLNEPELHWSNCTGWIPNGGAVSWVYVDNCKFQNGPLTIPSYAAGSIISACLFDTTVVVARYIDIVAGADNVIVTGCVFGSSTSEAVRVASARCVVSANNGCKVAETGAANYNSYSSNRGFINSTILGLYSSVEGFSRRSSSGATPAGFTQIVGIANPQGIQGLGTIKNTGANSLEVRESVTDLFGPLVSVTTVVLAGNDYMLDPQTNFGTARPPYTGYIVEVRHPGAASTYSMHFSSSGDTAILS